MSFHSVSLLVRSRRSLTGPVPEWPRMHAPRRKGRVKRRLEDVEDRNQGGGGERGLQHRCQGRPICRENCEPHVSLPRTLLIYVQDRPRAPLHTITHFGLCASLHYPAEFLLAAATTPERGTCGMCKSLSRA